MIHLTATMAVEDHRNVSDVLSKLRDVQQKKLDVIFKDVCMIAKIYLACLSQVECKGSFQRAAVSVDAQQAAVSVESRAHSCGTFCKAS